MTILALAKTLVAGTVTLQGNTFTFTASSSGTGTGNTVPEAEKSAIVASNTAAIIAARASIDKILTENSAVLTDLEITSLISNNLSTTVVVFKSIELDSIATTTDGINYTLIKDTVIETGQWLTVPNGKTLTTANYHFTNNGYFQVGEPSSSASTQLKDSTVTTAQVTYSSDASNNYLCEIYDGASSTIDTNVTFQNSAENAELLNYGTCYNSGTILNSEDNTVVINNGTFYNYDGSTIENSGDSSAIYTNGEFNNYSAIYNNGSYSNVTNSITFNNNTSGSTIENNGDNSYVLNQGSGADPCIFTNDGTIYNYSSSSYTTNSGTDTWTGTGTCCSDTDTCLGTCNITT